MNNILRKHWPFFLGLVFASVQFTQHLLTLSGGPAETYQTGLLDGVASVCFWTGFWYCTSLLLRLGRYVLRGLSSR